jgi:hypothetical protein
MATGLVADERRELDLRDGTRKPHGSAELNPISVGAAPVHLGLAPEGRRALAAEEVFQAPERSSLRIERSRKRRRIGP